ncbi:DUF4091 domain-containing protein [Paenibacillus apiarius]|nr:DUF4091 domain-containing protein [Paenibacillus apiarius]
MTMYVGVTDMFHKEVRSYSEWNRYAAIAEKRHQSVVSCKRDSAAFQVLVSSDEPFLLAANADTLFWKGGALNIARVEVAIEGAAVQPDVKLIGFMRDDDGTPKADLLLEDAHLRVEARQVQPVWVELTADEAMIAGTYHGRVRLFTHHMFADEQCAGECAFEWVVAEETLPEAKDYRFYLDLWQHSSNIARKYKTGLWTEEHFAVLDAYLDSMSKLGQKAVTVVVSEVPWSGQMSHNDRDPSDLFEYSIVSAQKAADGTFRYDFSALDRYIELGEKHGISREIEVFGLLNIWQDPHAGYGALAEGAPDAIRVRYYDETSGTYRFMREESELRAYVQALEAHFTSTGRMERVRILADEPSDYDLFNKKLAWLRQAAPAFKYKVAINHAEFVEKGMEGVSDYVPSFYCVVKEHERLMEQRPSIDGTLLYYVCCSPDRPNTFLGSPAMESRLVAWYVEQLGLDGFLRWNYTVWPDQPLEKLAYRSEIWKAGDTNFVYPGPLGKPLLSLRYKWLQRGIRDFELMQLLKERGEGERVKAALERVFRYKRLADCDPDRRANAESMYSLNAADYDELLLGDGAKRGGN